jgi:predicted amidophosphoribosyltransferase
MITICKNCGAALDETVQTCPDCGNPNPYAEGPFEAGLPSDVDPQEFLQLGLFVTGEAVSS